MRDLVTESKYIKREFGESLPTFKDVMEKHQVNKLKEDWWSNMSAKQQAAYIKAHPKSQQAQDATDDTAGDPDDSWDDEEGRAKPTGKTDADAWEDDPVGGDDVDDEEPEDDEPEKPEREPVKVKYDTGSQDKGNVWKGASGRFAAAHGYSGEKTGFDDPMAATAWASGLYDTPEDAIASIYEAKKEIIKVINGKKYKPIKESVNKRIAVKEVYKWLKGLEEYRYRKIPNVDVRRITSFVNNGLSEIDLPKSLQKKWESAKYSKEKNLADRFVKQKISQKLTQTESKHPLKEQYDRLFTDRTVL